MAAQHRRMLHRCTLFLPLSKPLPAPELLHFVSHRGSNAQAVSWHGQQCPAARAVLAPPQSRLQVSAASQEARQPAGSGCSASFTATTS